MTINVHVQDRYNVPIDICSCCGSRTPLKKVSVVYQRLIPLLIVNIHEKFTVELPSCDYCAPLYKKFEDYKKTISVFWIVISLLLCFSPLLYLFDLSDNFPEFTIWLLFGIGFALLFFGQNLPTVLARVTTKRKYPNFNTVIIGKVMDEVGYLLKFENENFGKRLKDVNTVV